MAIITTKNSSIDHATSLSLSCYIIHFFIIMAAAAAATGEWTVYYHGGAKREFKGRAEFLQLMLEDKKVPYSVSGDNLYGPKGMMDCFRGSAEAVLADTHSKANPIFFPPALLHKPSDGSDQILINQVGACVMYLGDVLGYDPKTAKERALANTITLNALDYIAEGRSSFHPVKNSMSYKDQQKEGDAASLEFTKTRMTIWLAHFEKLVKKNGSSTCPIAGSTDVTYADFVLFHVLDASIAQFNNEKYDMVWDKLNLKSLKEYHQWIKSRPNLKAYFESDRPAPFAGDSMM